MGNVYSQVQKSTFLRGSNKLINKIKSEDFKINLDILSTIKMGIYINSEQKSIKIRETGKHDLRHTESHGIKLNT